MIRCTSKARPRSFICSLELVPSLHKRFGTQHPGPKHTRFDCRSHSPKLRHPHQLRHLDLFTLYSVKETAYTLTPWVSLAHRIHQLNFLIYRRNALILILCQHLPHRPLSTISSSKEDDEEDVGTELGSVHFV